MQQILAILSSDADEPTITSALGSGNSHSYLHPTVLIVDGDETVLSSLSQTTGVIATLSDDAATNLATASDITQLDTPGMATLIGNTLGVNTTFDEPVVLAVAGWIFGFSPQYQAMQSDRPREGETWDMQGCLPDDSFDNA